MIKVQTFWASAGFDPRLMVLVLMVADRVPGAALAREGRHPHQAGDNRQQTEEEALMASRAVTCPLSCVQRKWQATRFVHPARLAQHPSTC